MDPSIQQAAVRPDFPDEMFDLCMICRVEKGFYYLGLLFFLSFEAYTFSVLLIQLLLFCLF